MTTEDADMERVAVSGLSGDRNQAKITVIGVPDRPGIAARIFGPVAEADIIVDMIIQNVGQGSLTDVSFTVPRADVGKAVGLMQRVAKEIEAKSVEVTEAIAKVSLVGVGMRSHSGVAARMFEVLSGEGVNIMMISTSEMGSIPRIRTLSRWLGSCQRSPTRRCWSWPASGSRCSRRVRFNSLRSLVCRWRSSPVFARARGRL